MSSKRFFITATGTDVGKTLLTAGLIWELRRKGVKAQAVKPVISGFEASNWATESDTGILLQAMERGDGGDAVESVSPWRFAAPVSPHLAARGVGTVLSPREIEHFCLQAGKEAEIILIEGAGGIMTPLAANYTQLDMAANLNLPLVLVTGSYVGAISHTLATIEAIRMRGLKIQAVVVSSSPSSNTSVADTAESILEFTPIPLRLFTIPHLSSIGVEKWKTLPPYILEVLQDD